MKIFKILTFISFATFVVISCSKQFSKDKENHSLISIIDESNLSNATISELQNWVHQNAGAYSDEKIHIDLQNTTIEGILDWNQIRTFSYIGNQYFEIPYTFLQSDGSRSKILPSFDTVASTIYSMLLKKINNTTLEARLKTTNLDAKLNIGTLYKSGKLEVYNYLDGTYNNGWFYINDSTVRKITEGNIANYNNQSNSFVSNPCYTVITTTVELSCYPTTGGGEYDATCVYTPITTYYTVCDGSTGGVGYYPPTTGGGGSSIPNPTPAPNPTLAPASEQTAHLCGAYKWKTVGNSFNTQFNNLSFTLVHTAGDISAINLGGACVTMSKSTIFPPNTTSGADAAFNDSWNRSLDQVVNEVNTGLTPPGDISVTNRMKALISEKLRIYYPGSTFNSQGCSGSIPFSTATYCAAGGQ